MKKKRLTAIMLAVVFLLLIPLIAMQFTNEVNWNLGDFIAAGFLLFTFCLMSELVLRKIDKTRHRILIFLTILVIFLAIWAELAVGIFGTPFAGT